MVWSLVHCDIRDASLPVRGEQSLTYIIDESSEDHASVIRDLVVPATHAHGHLHSLDATKRLQLVQVLYRHTVVIM